MCSKFRTILLTFIWSIRKVTFINLITNNYHQLSHLIDSFITSTRIMFFTYIFYLLCRLYHKITCQRIRYFKWMGKKKQKKKNKQTFNFQHIFRNRIGRSWRLTTCNSDSIPSNLYLMIVLPLQLSWFEFVIFFSSVTSRSVGTRNLI